jgi:surfeit locus 1 family protein
MRRIPAFATVLVGLAMAAMIALGLWQLRRADEKKAVLAQYAQAATRPTMAFPTGFVKDRSDVLFRTASALCLNPTAPIVEGGLGPSARAGWRHIVRCGTGVEGPGLLIDIGWTPSFDAKSSWQGGAISGVIAEMPQHHSLLARVTGKVPPPELVLIAAIPAPGFEASAPPSIDEVPNNHLAYAVQWFIFAGLAGLIYALSIRNRMKPPLPNLP